MAHAATMSLYSLSLQRASAISCAISGSFSAPRTQEVVVGRGKVLELLRPDDAGLMRSVHATEVFGLVRSLAPFRLQEEHRDYIIVGSDSGRIVILQYNPDKGAFDKIHQETYGKTGCRRIVPGQYLAADPRGRAVMIGAVEKQKLVYVLNRDDKARLTILSPLEAHYPHTLVFDMVGVDVGFDHPIFACLEVDYGDADVDPAPDAAAATPKYVTFYELDLGLNHVTRKWAEETERSANMLIPVPGGGDGPGGVLVCAENWIWYQNQDHPTLRTPLPRRADMPDTRGLLVTSFTVHKQKKGTFFFLIQTELGDLYKVTLDTTEALKVTDVRVKYFDTVAPGTALNIVVRRKTGFLFVAAEFGNHTLYKFRSLGDKGAVESTAVAEDAIEAGMVTCPMFVPGELTNLVPMDELQSLAPVTDFEISDLVGEGSPQLYTLCGRGPRSNLRVLRHGLSVTEIALSDMPGTPSAVFTIRGVPGTAAAAAAAAAAGAGAGAAAAAGGEAEPHKYIVVSFTDASIVLSIGDEVEVVEDSRLEGGKPTLALTMLPSGAMMQVTPEALRMVAPEVDTEPQEFNPGKRIVAAAANERQVAVAVTGHTIYYFEYSDEAGALGGEVVETLDTEFEIAFMDLADVPPGKLRCPYLAVALRNNLVHILSLDPRAPLTVVATQALTAPPSSVCLASLPSGQGAGETLFLSVGLNTGVLLRARVDDATGAVSDDRSRFLGARPVRLRRLQLGGATAVIAMSSRPWLVHSDSGRVVTAPLSHRPLDDAAFLCSGAAPEGVVAISGGQMSVFAVDPVRDTFNQMAVPLTYTPRRFVTLKSGANTFLVVVETDHNAFNQEERAAIREATGGAADGSGAGAASGAGAGAAEGEFAEENVDARVGVPLPPEAGKWASCVRVLSSDGQTLFCADLPENEAAFSVATCEFQGKGETFVLVGTAKNLSLHPRRHDGGMVHVYRLIDESEGGAVGDGAAAAAGAGAGAGAAGGGEVRLIPLQSTAVEDVPHAMAEFQGRMLISVGRILRIYDLGKHKLLRKCENRSLPNLITRIHTSGDRIYVCDVADSVHCAKYKRAENAIVVFADDTSPRHVVASVLLDHDTLCVSDKFGNVVMLRVPEEVSDDVDNPTGNRILWDTGYLNGAPNKLETLCAFHVGEVVTAMRKASMPGGSECVVYTTVLGSVGALLPITSRAEADYFNHLEMFCRAEAPSLVGRDHMSFRSYFQPVKNVVDGDLCEQFATMPADKQKRVADQLDAKVDEVLKRLEEVRDKII